MVEAISNLILTYLITSVSTYILFRTNRKFEIEKEQEFGIIFAQKIHKVYIFLPLLWLIAISPPFVHSFLFIFVQYLLISISTY